VWLTLWLNLDAIRGHQVKLIIWGDPGVSEFQSGSSSKAALRYEVIVLMND
jgi:hypothetical protein